jgi:hypothetical protein
MTKSSVCLLTRPYQNRNTSSCRPCYLPMQKISIAGALGWGICSVLSLNVLMVHSKKFTVIADGKHQTGGSSTLGITVCFESL